MIKIENIVEYKRAGDLEWRFVVASRCRIWSLRK